MMSQKRLILDGLWHCLCPSFNLSTLARRNITLPAKRHLRASSSIVASASHQRCYSTTLPPSTDELPIDTGENGGILSGNRIRHEKGPKNKIEKLLHYRETWQTPGVPMQLRSQSTPKLEAKLRNVAEKYPNVHNAMQILRLLIRDRCLHPEGRHYKWLIQCHTDPQRGSPILVRRLLSEMNENGIPADSGTLHAALQALAVHPDYILRQDILRALRDRWLPLSPDGWHYVVAGLIREHQFELALDHIEHMERKDIPVQDWLHSLLIYYLCEFQEFDQVHQLMRSRLSQGHDMTQELWTHVLEQATTALHHDITRFIWGRKVELGYLHPPHWLCSKVLEVAAHEGNTKLAASVVHYISTHDGMPLEIKDYEKLSESHLMSGNLYAALEVLCKAHQDGVVLQPSSIDAILTHNIQTKIRPRKVWAILKELKAERYDIPLGCARLVIEMCEYGARNDPFEVDDGIAFYKELYTLCHEKPDISIFNALISMCRRAKNTESAMFVVKEMAAFDAIPDATTFEHLVVMCLESGNFESAYLYFQDLRERGLRPREEARIEIRDLCAESDDEFALKLRYHQDIRDGLIHSPADEADAAQGIALFQKIRTTSTGEFADLPIYLKLKDAEREETHQRYLRMSKEARRQYNKERRKRKRRQLAIARAQEEDDWMNYEPGGLIPEDQTNTSKTSDD